MIYFDDLLNSSFENGKKKKGKNKNKKKTKTKKQKQKTKKLPRLFF